MAKEPPSLDEKPESKPEEAPENGSFLSKKMILIGTPIVIAQVVLAYFLVAKFVVPVFVHQREAREKVEQQSKADVVEPQIFVINDLIINPAGTNGTRFLLTTIGFEVNSTEAKQEMEKKEVQVRDVLNSILTSKALDSLVDVDGRETLRNEISSKVRTLMKVGQVQNVYFSKFIIQ
jgi:flagellar FliL protein